MDHDFIVDRNHEVILIALEEFYTAWREVFTG